MWILTFFLLAVSCIASPSREVGAYSRKSVTFVDAIWTMDESSKRIPISYLREILNDIRTELKLGRFDTNEIPESYMSSFVKEANKIHPSQLTTTEKLVEVLNQTIVAKIIEAVEAEKEMRALQLTTEQQRNSFISDKAKLLGVTETELNQVMSSAYIFLPVVRNYSSTLNGNTYQVSLDIGLIWFHINAQGDSVKATLSESSFFRCSAVSTHRQFYVGYGDYKSYAHGKVREQAIMNLKVGISGISDFQLSGQVMESGWRMISIDLGEEEGLSVGDFFRVFTYEEDREKNRKKVPSGWIRLNKLAKKDKMPNFSRAYVVSGKADLGYELQEYPLLPLELEFSIRNYRLRMPKEFSSKDWSLKLDGMNRSVNQYGPEFSMLYHLSSITGIPNLAYTLGFGIAIGGQSEIQMDNYQINSFFQSSAYTGFKKGWDFYRRLQLVTEIGLFTQRLDIHLDGQADKGALPVNLYNYTLGLYGGLGVDFIIHPQWTIGAQYRAHHASDNDHWFQGGKLRAEQYSADFSSNTVKVYLRFRPKSLGMDPINLLRGIIGF
jgi:hypothetical protein